MNQTFTIGGPPNSTRTVASELPYTIIREEHHDDGDYLSLRIAELPGFVVAARTVEELEAMFWPALAVFTEDD